MGLWIWCVLLLLHRCLCKRQSPSVTVTPDSCDRKCSLIKTFFELQCLLSPIRSRMCRCLVGERDSRLLVSLSCLNHPLDIIANSVNCRAIDCFTFFTYDPFIQIPYPWLFLFFQSNVATINFFPLLFAACDVIVDKFQIIEKLYCENKVIGRGTVIPQICKIFVSSELGNNKITQ